MSNTYPLPYLTLTYSWSDWLGAEEHHQDGGRHWHAFIQFNTAYRGRDPRAFDVGDLHPNIKSSKGTKTDLLRMWQYLHKEGYTTFGTWEGPEKDQ